VLAALALLAREQSKLGLPSGRFVLAGDSAGAQLAARPAAVITNSKYAKLAGVEPQLHRIKPVMQNSTAAIPSQPLINSPVSPIRS